MHKKCSGFSGRIEADAGYVCPRRQGMARPIDGGPVTQVYVDGAMLDVIANFIYLGDDLDAGGGCELAIAHLCSCIPERLTLRLDKVSTTSLYSR